MSHTIMIADDDVDDVFLIERTLKQAGYHVVSTTRGDQVLNIKKKIRPSLIILDILMPRIDGTEAATQLKEDAATRRIPVIFVSNLKPSDEETPQDRDPGRVVIGKPVHAKTLVEAVRRFLAD